MRTSKRWLAGAAAGALTAGLIPFVAVATATSANAETGTATVSPVRVTFTGSTQDAVPAARASFALPMAGTVGAALTIAPAGGTLTVGAAAVTLATPGTSVAVVAGTSTDDTYVTMAAAGAAGRYVGSIFDGTDTATFDFTTTGAPTSMTLTPATQTVLVGAEATMTATLRDAAGNITQPASVDTIALSTNTDDTVTPALVSATDIFSGTATATLDTTGNPAGTTTVTATPQGTLPSSGVATQTATVVKSGTVASVSVVGMSVTAPANAVNGGTTPNFTAIVPEGTATVTVQVDDTTSAAAGNRIRLEATASAGTLNGTTTLTQYVDVTTDANKKATATFTLGGAALLASATLTITQVDVTDTQVGNVNLVVTQTAPTVVIEASPDDSVVAALGATTNVNVTVADQFGTALSGWTVRAFRGLSTGGTFLTQAVTNASGVAVVGVTNAAGVVAGAVEQYSFSAQPPVGPITNADNLLQINYTTDGNITSLSVAVAGGATTPITDTTTAITTAPVVGVPASGTAETQSTATYTVATGVASGAANGGVAGFTPTAAPLNNVTVTAPAGLSVSTDAETAWDEGQSSVTVSSGTPVYVFGLTVGTYDVTFTSGGKTVTAPVKITTSANNAYNINLTPEAQGVALGAIGTATLSVTDVFGNPVQGATADDTGAVTITASGAVLLAGFSTTQNVVTGADGNATITFIAGNAVGEGILTATPRTGTPTPAWQTGYEAPANAPAPKTSAAAEIGVGQAPVEPAILIEGDRTNRRIQVDGVTFGLAASTEISPWIRFPGQVGFTQGVARPQITIVDTDEQIGEFTWGRNAGKRTVVEIRTADGLRSNRIIIPAR